MLNVITPIILRSVLWRPYEILEVNGVIGGGNEVCAERYALIDLQLLASVASIKQNFCICAQNQESKSINCFQAI